MMHCALIEKSPHACACVYLYRIRVVFALWVCCICCACVFTLNVCYICTVCVCVCVVFALCVSVVFAVCVLYLHSVCMLYLQCVCVCVCVAFAVCVCSVSQRSPHICLIPPATTLLTVAQCKFITDCKINHLGGRKYLNFVLLCFVFVFVLKLCDFERQIIFVIIALICVNSKIWDLIEITKNCWTIPLNQPFVLESLWSHVIQATITIQY